MQAVTAGQNISDALGRAVSTEQATKSVRALTDSIATLARAPKNFNATPVISGLDGVAAAAGISQRSLEGMYGAMVRTANQNALESAMKRLQAQTGFTAAEMAKLRREAGDVSGALRTAMGALNTRSQSAIVAEMKEAVAAFKEIRRNADSTASDVQRASLAMRESLKRLSAEARGVRVAPTVNVSGFQQALTQVQASSRLSAQELARLNAEATRFGARRDLDSAFARIQQEAGLSTVQLARLRAEMGDVRGSFSTLATGAGQAKLALAAGAATVGIAGKACLDAALQTDRLDKAYSAITGSGAQAQMR